MIIIKALKIAIVMFILIISLGNKVSKIKKEIRTAMIYTMNVTKEMDYFNGEDQLAFMMGYRQLFSVNAKHICL